MKHFCAHTLTWSSCVQDPGLEHAETRRATSSQKMCIKKRWVHVSCFLGAWWTDTPAGHELVAWGEAPCGVIKDESNFFMHTCLAICIKGMRVYKECRCKAFALFHYHVIIPFILKSSFVICIFACHEDQVWPWRNFPYRHREQRFRRMYGLQFLAQLHELYLEKDHHL